MRVNEVVTVIGLGYVGLPLALAAAKNGYRVNGFDIDSKKIEQLKTGVSQIEDISGTEVLDLISSNRLQVGSDAQIIANSDIFIICVPTPLDLNRKPDLKYLHSALVTISNYLTKGCLVIVESTIAPGTTRNELLPKLEELSGLTTEDFDIAFSPERVDPRNSDWSIHNTPKLISGYSTAALERAKSFYSKFVEHLVICDSLEIAETAKLLENTFRLINISFVNQIAMICQSLDVNVSKVIAAASTKPYGFMPFYPSLGIGGHCIPVDPIYLSSKAKEFGAPTSLIDLADEINQNQPNYFAKRAELALSGLTGKKILIVGLSYKPNVSDIRETPVISLINILRQKGANVFWHDDLVKTWNGETSSALNESYDLIIIATLHDYINLAALRNVKILDTKGSIN